jgi:allophanate hydrolase
MVHEENGSPAAAWIAKFASLVVHARPSDALAFDLPLAGLRFAVKDNIDVGGVPTTAGCPAFERTPSQHAAVVQKLLEAGASLLGKTNLDQFACGLNGTRSPYGEVPNAFDARYVSAAARVPARPMSSPPVKSTSRSAPTPPARVACPPGLNNIVGLKPSRGLVSARGVVPAAQSVDCVSIFAAASGSPRACWLAALGPDPLDPYSRIWRWPRSPYPRQLHASACPTRCRFFGDELAPSRRSSRPPSTCADSAARPCRSTTRRWPRPPTCCTAARWSPSATPPCAASSTAARSR